MTKEDILNIIKRCSTIDINENIKYVDVMDYDKLASMLEKAINYKRCSEQLDDKGKYCFKCGDYVGKGYDNLDCEDVKG